MYLSACGHLNRASAWFCDRYLARFHGSAPFFAFCFDASDTRFISTLETRAVTLAGVATSNFFECG
jgi:hypothetical protein